LARDYKERYLKMQELKNKTIINTTIKMKRSKQKITIIVEKTKTGFSAYAKDIPVFTTGRTIPELIDNTLESVNFYLEDQDIQILPKSLNFEIDFKQFFQFYKVINAKFLAEKIGMNPTLLSQYVQGRKRPSTNQTDKILDGIHQIGRELSDINLFHRI